MRRAVSLHYHFGIESEWSWNTRGGKNKIDAFQMASYEIEVFIGASGWLLLAFHLIKNCPFCSIHWELLNKKLKMKENGIQKKLLNSRVLSQGAAVRKNMIRDAILMFTPTPCMDYESWILDDIYDDSSSIYDARINNLSPKQECKLTTGSGIHEQLFAVFASWALG